MIAQNTPADKPDDLATLEKDLREAVTVASTPAKQPAQKQASDASQADVSEDDIPVKLRGKSTPEVYKMYKDLESDRGRLANDLGVQRQLTDRLLDLKRGNDLTQHTPPQQQSRPALTVKSDELLEDPTGTIDKMVTTRLAETRDQLNQRLSSLEVSLAQGRLASKHPDYLEYPNNSDFVDWVKQSPIRSRVAALAAQGDAQAIDELLTEYKGRAKQDVSETTDAARKAALEGTSPQKASGGKEYSRAAIMRMRIERPDLYSSPAFQAEITKAYAEKRVK